MAKFLTPFAGEEMFNNDPDGEELKVTGTSFFRGENCNFFPIHGDRERATFFDKFVLKGLVPDKPLIGRSTRVTAFGSCFAGNITNHLDTLGFDLSRTRNPEIYISALGEGLVNVHALAGQMEWALENAPVPAGLWHGYKGEEYGDEEGVRRKTAETLRNTDFFIVTFGLSEIWYDEPTGGVFWRAVPKRSYDPERHKFRVCTFAETRATIERMYALIRKHVPEAKVLFTLSPIPLMATFRPIPAMVASSASKAILRAALDEFLRDHEADLNQRLFYFPAYEIVNELFFQKFAGDGRHIDVEIIKVVMMLFEATYCDTGLTMDEVTAQYRSTRAHNADNLQRISKP
jgi:hypothetical protein